VIFLREQYVRAVFILNPAFETFSLFCWTWASSKFFSRQFLQNISSLGHAPVVMPPAREAFYDWSIEQRQNVFNTISNQQLEVTKCIFEGKYIP